MYNPGSVTLEEIYKEKKYKRMSVDFLEHVINYELSLEEYGELEGFMAKGKAKILYENLRSKK
jgi:hypothetical protein